MVTRSPDLVLTDEGMKRLKDELEALRERLSAKVAEQARARAVATDPQTAERLSAEVAHLRARVVRLQEAIDRAEIRDLPDRGPAAVGIGSRVRARWDDGRMSTYLIVGLAEADPRSGRLSYESPVAQALIGKRQGERVEVEAPGGRWQLSILPVRRAHAPHGPSASTARAAVAAHHMRRFGPWSLRLGKEISCATRSNCLWTVRIWPRRRSPTRRNSRAHAEPSRGTAMAEPEGTRSAQPEA
jgi:transcription elongation factor GreA